MLRTSNTFCDFAKYIFALTSYGEMRVNRVNESGSNSGGAENEEATSVRKDDAECAFCDLFMSEAEAGKVGKKDAQLFSAHLDTAEHPPLLDSLAKSGYDQL
jgi:hypothetical protein